MSEQQGGFAGENRSSGGFEGRLVVGEDFDDPLPEWLLALFEGREGSTNENEGRRRMAVNAGRKRGRRIGAGRGR